MEPFNRILLAQLSSLTGVFEPLAMLCFCSVMRSAFGEFLWPEYRPPHGIASYVLGKCSGTASAATYLP